MTIDTTTMHMDDTIDVRNIIERIEKLENLKGDYEVDPDGGHWSNEDAQELRTLTDIVDDLMGYGGDEQWRGDWYPMTLVREDHFTDYVRELVRGCYDLKGLPNFVHIDWEATAREVRLDYSAVEINGVTFLYR